MSIVYRESLTSSDYVFSDYNKIRRSILYFFFSEYYNLGLSYLSFVQPDEIPVRWSVNDMGVHEWICHPFDQSLCCLYTLFFFVLCTLCWLFFPFGVLWRLCFYILVTYSQPNSQWQLCLSVLCSTWWNPRQVIS
jgi:hypothetical protein